MWVNAVEMNDISLDIKTRPYQGADKWQHNHITKTPEFVIQYHNDEHYLRSNSQTVVLSWTKGDYRHPQYPGRWFMDYWTKTELVQKYSYYRVGKDKRVTGRYLNPKYKTKQELYEDALEQEIHNAIKRLNKKWAKKIAKDYEQEHQDPMVKFVNAEPA